MIAVLSRYFRVVGTKIAIVTGPHETVASFDGREPERLARILVYEMLVRAAFAKALGDQR